MKSLKVQRKQLKLFFPQIEIFWIKTFSFRKYIFSLCSLLLLVKTLGAHQTIFAIEKPEKLSITQIDYLPKTKAKLNFELFENQELNPAELIHLGDVIDIDVLGTLDYDWRGQTNDEGLINNLPSLTDSIPALCRTTDELAADVAQAYSKFLRNPQVVIRIIDRTKRQPALLVGAIQTPQRLQILRSVQLSELIVLAGGITDRASGAVQIFRPANLSCVAHNQKQSQSEFVKIKLSDLINGQPEANAFVREGDIVTIEESSVIYLIGSVAAPQRVLFRQGITLDRAISSAGGLSGNWQNAKITIFRRQPNSAKTEIIETKLDAVKTAKDIELKANDVIEISSPKPTRGVRAPIINQTESTESDVTKLPLRVIN